MHRPKHTQLEVIFTQTVGHLLVMVQSASGLSGKKKRSLSHHHLSFEDSVTMLQQSNKARNMWISPHRERSKLKSFLLFYILHVRAFTGLSLRALLFFSIHRQWFSLQKSRGFSPVTQMVIHQGHKLKLMGHTNFAHTTSDVEIYPCASQNFCNCE